jgi:hypothetical protein
MAHTHPTNLLAFLAVLFSPAEAVADPLIPQVEDWTDEDELHYRELEARHQAMYPEDYHAAANQALIEDHTRFPLTFGR